jgi:hypothetical protein
MSASGTYLLNCIPSGTNAKDFFTTYIVDTNAESIIKQAAHDDACRYVYNAVISFLSGITGLHSKQIGWTVTKLYYCAFYIGRAALCRSNHVVFHAPRPLGNGFTQFELRGQAGQQAKIVKQPASTHKLVALRFKELGYPPFMTGLEINGLDPVLWLMDQREYWQYRASRFPDPDSPPIFDQLDTHKAQRLLEEYASDRTGVFLSDPSHAMVSIPFRLVKWALSQESLISPGIATEEDIAYLRKCCHIGKQTLTILSRHLI